MATINRIDKAMVVITMVDYLDNETKYLLDTRNHKIFTKFTPDLEGNLGKSDLEQLKNEMLEINLAYIPILREYEDILKKIVK